MIILRMIIILSAKTSTNRQHLSFKFSFSQTCHKMILELKLKWKYQFVLRANQKALTALCIHWLRIRLVSKIIRVHAKHQLEASSRKSTYRRTINNCKIMSTSNKMTSTIHNKISILYIKKVKVNNLMLTINLKGEMGSKLLPLTQLLWIETVFSILKLTITLLLMCFKITSSTSLGINKKYKIRLTYNLGIMVRHQCYFLKDLEAHACKTAASCWILGHKDIQTLFQVNLLSTRNLEPRSRMLTLSSQQKTKFSRVSICLKFIKISSLPNFQD